MKNGGIYTDRTDSWVCRFLFIFTCNSNNQQMILQILEITVSNCQNVMIQSKEQSHMKLRH